MPQHTSEGARLAAVRLQEHHIPLSFCYTGGGCDVTYVPLTSDEMDPYRVQDGPHLGIVGDESAVADDRFAVVLGQGQADYSETPVASDITLTQLVGVVWTYRNRYKAERERLPIIPRPFRLKV